MMTLLNDFTIRCKCCKSSLSVSKNDYEPDVSYYDHGDNAMGEEIEYSIEDQIKCPICGNTISFSIYGSEYPIDAYNDGSCDIKGAIFVNNPQFGIIYEPDENALDVDYLETIYSLNNFLCQHQIDTLYHFTKVQNLPSIFNYGLMPRSTIEQNKIHSSFNDDYRYDDCLNANCISIEFPNYRMFYKYRQADRNVNWVVLKLNKQILFDFKCAYCWTNAADSSMYNVPIKDRMNIDSFFGLFDNRPNYPKREDTQISEWFPTNPQAEILVFGTIPITYIDSIYFKDYQTLNKYKNIIPCSIRSKVNPEVFSYRSDWKYWC